MKFATSLFSLAITGVLALPAPQQGGFNQGQQPPPNTNALQQSSPQQFQTQPDTGTQAAFVQTIGPGFSVLIAVETSPKGEKAIVAWAFGRSQCVERQLVSKGLNFCGKWLEFNRVPELDPGLSPTGDWEQVYVTFLGCDENSRNGDYSGIYMAVFMPGEFEGNFNQQSPNTQSGLGGQQIDQGTPQGMGLQPNQLAPNQNQQLQPAGGVPASNNLQAVPQQQNTGALPQTQQLQGANAPGSEQIPSAALAQLPPQLPIQRMQQQQNNQLPQGDPAELGVDPTTGQTAGLGWNGGDQSGTGVGGGLGSGLWGGWTGAYVEFYHCNSDREMHGCAYNNEDDTDLTTFLSCGDYAYTMDKTPDQGDGSGSSSGGGQK